MTNPEKLRKAISVLKNNVDYTNHNSVIDTEEMFSKIIWLNGENESLTPPSEITWEKVKIKMTEIQTNYDALEYKRKRKAEYPSIAELVVALYDTEDKLALENKRAAVKLKYPKENS